MTLDMTQLLLGVLFSSIGIGYSIYGKRQHHKVAFYSGLALMFYPYLVHTSLMLVVIGITLMLVPRFVVL